MALCKRIAFSRIQTGIFGSFILEVSKKAVTVSFPSSQYFPTGTIQKMLPKSV